MSSRRRVPISRMRKNAGGILISCLAIVMVVSYLIAEFLEEGSLTGLLEHLTKPSLTFYHIMVFFSIPALMLIGYFYQKQHNLTENLEQLVEERTSRLRESEEKFRLTFENAKDAIFWADPATGLITNCNKAAETLFEKKREKIIGHHQTTLHPPQKAEYYVKMFKRHIEQKGSVDDEAEIITKSGKIKPIHITASVTLVGGKPLIQGIFRDITERKKAEERIRESEEKFRNIFDSAYDGMIYLDRSGRILDVNRKAVEMFGGSKKELVGKHFTKVGVFSLREIPTLMTNFANILAGKKATVNIDIKNKKGQEIPLECSASFTKINGKFAGVMVIARDITERKKAEEKLRESEERFRNLFESAGDGILTLDLRGRVTSANKKVEEISGLSREEIIGKHPIQFVKMGIISLKDVPLILKMLATRIKDQHSKVYEYRVKNKKGQEKIIECRGSLIKHMGKPIGILEIIRDVTERKKMEEKLREYAEHLEEKVEERTRELKESQEQLLRSERLAAIGELATMVGHDLRNPLQSIENATYYLNNELSRLSSSIPIPQKAMKMLQVINDSVNYADRIIRDLQDFSAPKKPTLEKTDINSIVIEALSQVEVPENVELITELDHLPEIKVDKDMMKRVFLNLALNGIQAMENGGRLKVSTKKTKGFVEVSFKDTGIGIPKEHIEKIFTPFFTTKATGMGMGLPICKKFVDTHGGSIQVKSEKGKGSTFTVKLPIQPRQMEVKTIVEE